MDLEEQRNVIEHGLSERMINHAFTIVNQWTLELGFQTYHPRIHAIIDSYNRTFDYYLTMDDPERDTLLDHLTHDAFKLADEVYVDLRLKRGLSPQVRGYNGDNIQSVMQYFSSCVKFTPEDYNWLRQIFADPDRQTLALMTLAALTPNLLECFDEQILLILIDNINQPQQFIADQALATSILVLARYDIRIDFFPDIQAAFEQAIGDGERAFQILNAYVHMVNQKPRRVAVDTSHLTLDTAQDFIRNIIDKDVSDVNMEDVITIMPESEREYLTEIVASLPNTWVYDVIIGEDNSEREQAINMAYLSIGGLDYMEDNLDIAEQFLVERIRTGNAYAIDYINYGHCCFIRGDRLMAFENYRQARNMCKSLKEFYAIFRPGRTLLAEKQVPLEQIYLMEDHLVDAD